MSTTGEKSLHAAQDPGLPTAHDGAPLPLSQRVRALRLPSQEASRGSRIGWIAWLLCFVFAASTAVLAYFLATQPKPPAAAAAPNKTDPSLTPSGEPAPSTPGAGRQIALQGKGYVIPAHQILVSPKVTGEITRLNILEGKRVQKGDVLAELETTDYDADVRRAEAALAAARQKAEELRRSLPEEQIQVRKEMEEAEAELKRLKSAHERNLKLRQAGESFISDQDLEESESRYRAMDRRVERLASVLKLMTDGTRELRIRAAEADVQQAEAELTKAQWRRGNCTIVAPISGTILRKNAEIGNLVNPIAFAGSTSLCEMADLSKLEIEVSVQERDLHLVHDGQDCRVWAEAFPNHKYTGRARLMPVADRGKGAVWVRVEVLDIPAADEGVYLKPDMGAMVVFWKDAAPAEK